MSQLKAWSPLTDEVIDIGLPTEDIGDLANLGEFMATGRESLIVFLEGPAIQRWD